MTGHIQLGLEVELSLPQDSYILDYVEVSKSIKLGPSVYFVVEEGYDYATLDDQNKICTGPGCNEDSLLGQIFQASQNPKRYLWTQLFSVIAQICLFLSEGKCVCY